MSVPSIPANVGYWKRIGYSDDDQCLLLILSSDDSDSDVSILGSLICRGVQRMALPYSFKNDEIVAYEQGEVTSIHFSQDHEIYILCRSVTWREI